MRPWLAVPGVVLWPLIVILWVVTARRFGVRLEWYRPSWSANPLELSRPLEFLHLSMWMHFVGGLAMLAALPATGNWHFAQTTGAFACALVLWAISKALMRIHGVAPSSTSPGQSG